MEPRDERRLRQLMTEFEGLRERVDSVYPPGRDDMMIKFMRGSDMADALFQRRNGPDGKLAGYDWVPVLTTPSAASSLLRSIPFFHPAPNPTVQALWYWHQFAIGRNFIAVTHKCKSGTVDFNIQIREFATWDTVTGTDIFSSVKSVSSTAQREITFDGALEISVTQVVCLVFSNASNPVDVVINLEF